MQSETVSCLMCLNEKLNEKNTCSLANNMSLQYSNTVIRDFVFLWKMFVHSLWPCYHDLSRRKVKTVEIQNFSCSIDYDFKALIFLHCQHQQRLTFRNFLLVSLKCCIRPAVVFFTIKLLAQINLFIYYIVWEIIFL